jgi:hypothetical protein
MSEFLLTIHHAVAEAAMERVAVARMATAKLQGWIHAARGMGVSASVATKLNGYEFFTPGIMGMK